MAPKRKQVRICLIVSVPADMTAAHARREVRTLINDQCNYSADEGDVRVKLCVPMPVSGRAPPPKHYSRSFAQAMVEDQLERAMGGRGDESLDDMQEAR